MWPAFYADNLRSEIGITSKENHCGKRKRWFARSSLWKRIAHVELKNTNSIRKLNFLWLSFLFCVGFPYFFWCARVIGVPSIEIRACFNPNETDTWLTQDNYLKEPFNKISSFLHLCVIIFQYIKLFDIWQQNRIEHDKLLKWFIKQSNFIQIFWLECYQLKQELNSEKKVLIFKHHSNGKKTLKS